jgi:hypothetical protein
VLARRKILFWYIASRHLPSAIALDKVDSLDLKARKGELCGGKNEGKCRYDLSAISWRCIFIAKTSVNRFIGQHWIEMQLMEGGCSKDRGSHAWPNKKATATGATDSKNSFIEIIYTFI